MNSNLGLSNLLQVGNITITNIIKVRWCGSGMKIIYDGKTQVEIFSL